MSSNTAAITIQATTGETQSFTNRIAKKNVEQIQNIWNTTVNPYQNPHRMSAADKMKQMNGFGGSPAKYYMKEMSNEFKN